MTTGRPSSSADRHRVHRAVVAGERAADRGAGGQVPHPYRPVVAAGDDHRAAVQLRDRHRIHRVVVAGDLLVGALQLPGCPAGAPRAGQAVGVDAVGEGFGSSASRGEAEVGGVLGGRVAADQRKGAAVGTGGGAGGLAGSGVQGGKQFRRIGGEQEPGILGEIVDAAAAGGVGGQVGAGVGVAGGPVRPSAVPAGHVAGQRRGDGALVGGLVPVGEQVFGEGAVVEPVGRPVGDGAAFDDERAGVAGQPQQVLVGVAVAGGQGVGQQRPHIFPGQAAALGVGQREQQVHRLRGPLA